MKASGQVKTGAKYTVGDAERNTIILIELEGREGAAEPSRQYQENISFSEVIDRDALMRSGHASATSEQNEGIEKRNGPGVDGCNASRGPHRAQLDSW